MYYNARSVVNKWDELCADMSCEQADIFCVSESWLARADNLQQYACRDFITFGSCRPSRRSGDVMVLMNPQLCPVECTPSTTTTDIFNICAVKLLNRTPQTTVIAVYLPPSSRVSDSRNLIEVLSSIIKRLTSFLIVGDFNYVTDWSMQRLFLCSGVAGELVQFMNDFNLRQLNNEPLRLANTLDLVLVPPRLYKSEVSQLPPFSGSDHMTQEVKSLCVG